MNSRTIYSLITGFQKNPVSIIRVSGPISFKILKMTKLKNINHQETKFSKFYDPFDNNKFLDEGLISYFKKPFSYTGEDIFEFSFHGGIFNQKKFMTVMEKLNFQQSKNGEFSYQAFRNKKITVNKIEAINKIIDSENYIDYEIGRKNIENLSIKNLKKYIINILTYSEVLIDFDNEENIIDNNLNIKILKNSLELKEIIENTWKNQNIIEKFKNFKNITIIGPPNVGKSSLFNFINKRDLSIVTNFPGTTRDIISVF